MRAFLRDICLRPSCYECPAKAQTSGSDITLGDFWGVQNHLPELDDNKGTSLVCVNTEKGARFLEKIRPAGTFVETPYTQGLKGNPALEHDPQRHAKRVEFFEKLERGEKLYDFVFPITQLPFPKRARAFVIRCAHFALRKTGTFNLAKRILKK